MSAPDSSPREQNGDLRQRPRTSSGSDLNTSTKDRERTRSEPRAESSRTDIQNGSDGAYRRSRSLSPFFIGPHKRARKFANRVMTEALQTPIVHFPEGKLAPPPVEDKDKKRDDHDLANLIVLPILLLVDFYFLYHGTKISWWIFFATVTVYFVGDLTWVLLVPSCVKSTLTIKMHHTVSILYLILPFTYPEFGHFLGYCMLVELNTWFLIARRYWRRNSKIFSIGFYFTWVTVRVGLFTYLMVNSFEAYLEKVFPQLDVNHSGALSRKELLRLRNWVHLMMLAPLFQTVFCALNWKWTWDLVKQKLKGQGPGKGL